jgi:phage shock protein A
MTKEELEKEAKVFATYYESLFPNEFETFYKAFLKVAEPREKRIAELEDKLANADYQLEGRDNEIRELEAQIEKMKNCKNCANYMIIGKCPSFFRTGWCKNWEMTRSKK